MMKKCLNYRSAERKLVERREGERDLDLGRGSGGVEVVGERGHGAHKGQNGYGKGQQSVRSITE